MKRRSILLLGILVTISGCFGRPGDPMTQQQAVGCMLAAPICAWQRQESLPAKIGVSLAVLPLWPVAVFAFALVAAHDVAVENCHQIGGNYVCVGTVCRCVTVE